MATVRIPPVLRPEAGGQRQIELDAGDVRALLDGLVATFPALGDRLLEDGSLPEFLNVFVDGEDIRASDGLATKVRPASTVILLPAMAGGDPASARSS